MLWKCCTQYANKFGKLSSDHRTGKGQFSFQCSNYHTTALFSHASKVMLKFSKSGFNSTWTVNFQMFKLDLEKGEEPDIKLPTSVGSLKKQESSENIYFCFIDYAKAFDCVDHSKLWKILKEMGIPNHLTCFLRNLYVGKEATVRTGHGQQSGFKSGKEYIKAVYCTLLI